MVEPLKKTPGQFKLLIILKKKLHLYDIDNVYIWRDVARMSCQDRGGREADPFKRLAQGWECW